MMAGKCADCGGSETQHKLGGSEGCECFTCIYRTKIRCRTFTLALATPAPGPVRRKRGQREVLNAATDTPTQFDGGDMALPKAGTRRREAYDVIRAAGAAGVTFDELCGDLGRDYSRTGPRVRELVADGWVRKAPFRRQAVSGAMQDVWVATCYPESEGGNNDDANQR